jgi:hypothetical protein
MIRKPRKKASKPSKQDQLLLVGAVKLLIRQIGDPRLAITEIERELAGARLCSYRHDIASGKQAPESPEFWETHFIHYSEEGYPHIRIHTVQKDRWNLLFPHPEDEPPAQVYFVLQSDFHRLFSAAAESADDMETLQRRKPGRQTTANWKLHVAGELHRIVLVEKKPAPPASYFAQFCENKLRYQPDISAVQKLLRNLLG